MKKALKRPLFYLAIILTAGIMISFFTPVEKLSMKLVAKSLNQGKSVSTSAVVYYQISGGLLVTHFISPIETVVITNSKGEMKIYNVKDNTVVQSQGLDYSSENSYFYFFLNGKTQDMGLKSMGFTLKDTKIESNLVVTTWKPNEDLASVTSKAELVIENYKPIFMSFSDNKGKVAQKIYFTKYQKIGDFNIPMNITEFQYAKNDSVITKRSYSDPKLNQEVEDDTYLNYKIPANAKVIN